MRRALALLSVVALAALACGDSLGAESIRKKYVAFGWEFGQATVSNLLSVVDSLDATALDGIGCYLNVTGRDGKRVDGRIMTAPALRWEDLEPWVPAYLELTRHRSMRETFIKSFSAPMTRIAWTDDAAWKRIATSMRYLARLARRGGLKGLSVDDEDYHHQRLFKQLPTDPQGPALFDLVRARAREVFAPAFEEYPEMTVFLFRFFTAGRAYPSSPAPLTAQRNAGDLWPSFLNGLLDVLPAKAKLVDGYEESYLFDSQKEDYLRGYVQEKSRLVNMAEGANRAKYQTQVSSSMAIYLDMYINPEGSRYYSAPLNGTRFGHLAANLDQVTYAVDEYVWFWGEKRCWADWTGVRKFGKNISPERWTTIFPELCAAMEVYKDPIGYAKKTYAALKASGTFVPENANPACTRPPKAKKDSLVAPYAPWSDKQVGPEGRFYFDTTVGEDDSSSICAEGVAAGCVTLSAKGLSAGNVCLAGFAVKGASASGTLYWKRDGTWDFSIPGVSFPLSEPDSKGWRHGLVAVRVPNGADGFGMQMGVRQGPGEKTWFDNAFYCTVR